MKRLNAERGQSLLMITAASLMMFGLLGLVVDLGWMRYLKQSAQAAAESAAMAAAKSAYDNASGASYSCGGNVVCQSATACPSSPVSPPAHNDNIGSGCLYARQNGFTAGGQGGRQNVTIAANITSPPPTAPSVAVSYWTTATVTQRVPQLFSAVLGFSYGLVAARATAAVFPTASGAGGCIYVLAPGGSSVTLSGNPSITSGCGIYVNSNSSAAILSSGVPTITTTNGAYTNVVGGIQASGNLSITPAAKTGVPVTPDPFESYFSTATLPDASHCDSMGVNLSGSGTATLTPGVYCGGINISGSLAITMNPGIYVLKAGINMSGSTSITGNGVFLYAPSGGINMSGGGGVTLSPMASGIWQGITYYQPKSNTSGDTLSGGPTQSVSGLIYAPGATLTWSGSGGMTGTNTTLAVSNIVWSGTTYIKNGAANAAGGGAGGPVLALVE